MKGLLTFPILLIVLFCIACSDSKKNNAEKSHDNDSVLNTVLDSVALDDSLMMMSDSNAIVNDSVRQAILQEASKVSAHGEIAKTQTNQDFTLGQNGIGIIKVGGRVSDLPNKYDGLYDKKKIISDGAGGKICLLYSKNEQIIELDFNKKSDKINSIRLTTPSIKTEDGIRQFMDLKSILKIDKVKKVLGSKKQDDLFSFELNGIRYELDENLKGDNKFVSSIVIGK